MKYELLTALGLRVYPTKLGELRMPEGAFGRDLRGRWHVRPPGCDMGPIDEHAVTEHADGTITVAESIDGSAVGQGHWRLERGVWTSLEAASRVNRMEGSG